MTNTTNTNQAIWLSVGSLFSSLIGIITPIILSRCWSKYDLGTYKQVMYIYNTLLIVFTLGLPKTYSYFLPRYPEAQAKKIINKIDGIFLVIGFFFSLFLFFNAPLLARWLNNDNLVIAIKVFSPAPLFLLLTMGVESVFATYKKTQFMAIYTITTRSITIIAVIIPVLFWNGTYIDSIIGYVCASSITCLIALFIKRIPVKAFKVEQTTITYRDIFKFSFPLFLSSFWILIISSADQFFVSHYFGNEVFAEFSNGFIEIPFISMITHAIASVLLPIFSKCSHLGASKDALSLWFSTMTKSIKVLYPIVVFCICFSSTVVACLYGKQYSSSSTYFILKNLTGLLTIVPFQAIILAIGKTKAYSNVHMITAILIIVVEYICVKVFNTPIAIAVASVFCIIVKSILQLSIVARHVNLPLYKVLPISTMIRLTIFSTTVSIITHLIIKVLSIANEWAVLFTALIVFVILFYTGCWLCKITYKDIVSGIIRNPRILRIIP